MSDSSPAPLFIGLMSGTSLDAIDAALVALEPNQPPRLLHACNYPIPTAMRHAALALCASGHNEICRTGELDRQFGQLFAEAVAALLQQSGHHPAQIRAIGSHGQTIRHHPEASPAFSWQIGDPNTIALQTGITTVADFRRMDIAAGGQGAPLVPAFHAATLRAPGENRVVVNIGGMANLTTLFDGVPVIGFDTGPGNVLMDGWIQRHRQQPQDTGGQWAASGQCQTALLAKLLAHPYLHQPFPKSTGRETFHLAWLDEQLRDFAELPAADVQGTLLELTASSISQAIHALGHKIDKVLLCGGGSHNTLLCTRLAALLPDTVLTTTTTVGVDADWLEAMAFAWLAERRLAGLPGNLPAVTGAARSCVLGGVYLPT